MIGLNSKHVPGLHLNRWLFALCAGIVLLLAESLAGLKGDYYIYIPSLPLFIVPSLIAVAGIYLAAILGFYRESAKKPFFVTLAGFVIYMALLFFMAKSDLSSPQAIGLPLLIIIVLVVLYVMEGWFRILSGLGQAGFYILVFILWIWVSPEVRIFENKAGLWPWLAHICALSLILVFGYRGVVHSGIRSRWLALAFVMGVVIVFILGGRAWHTGEILSPPSSYNPVEMHAGMRSHPNIVVVVLDTLRKDHLSIYGYERLTSPFIDAWSKGCQVFTNAVSVSPWTLPSHASLFTGLFPRSHGAHFFLPKSMDGIPPVHSYPLGPSFKTLAEIFRQNGFDTGAVVSNRSFVTKRYGMDQGFDYFDQGQDNPRILFGRSDLVEFFACHLLDMHPVEMPYILAAEVTARALAWTQKRKDKPFFLFLNYMDTHWPYVPPPPFRDAFPGRKKGLFLKIDEYMNLKERMLAQGGIASWEKDHIISQYDGAILHFDESFRKLIQGLDQQGFLENTCIYFLSDHGESFGDHDHLEHGNDVYENEIAIPLLIYHPYGKKTGKVYDRVFIVDLFPTILLNAGINPPEDIEGVPIPTAIPEDANITKRDFDPLAELYYTNWGWLFSPYGDRFKRIRRAIYQDDFKVIVSSDGQHEIFDLESDPGEMHNLVSTRPDLVHGAEAVVNHYLEMTVEPPPAAWPDIDDQDIQLMKSLGYLR